ncbi:MAG: MarR family transcriptional regulator [Actinomycetota bacterium]|nr:MarR family transcriptional regulator [Actinomycetota bacterium]
MSPDPPPRYAASVSFLLSQVGARSAQVFAERLAPLDVTPRAFGVLSNLASEPGQTQQQLADALGIHRNNMVGLIDEMEAAGWVRRERSVTDRRAFNVQLTRTGTLLLSRVGELIVTLDQELDEALGEGDRTTLIRLLGELAAALKLTPGVHPYLRTSSH